MPMRVIHPRRSLRRDENAAQTKYATVHTTPKESFGYLVSPGPLVPFEIPESTDFVLNRFWFFPGFVEQLKNKSIQIEQVLSYGDGRIEIRFSLRVLSTYYRAQLLDEYMKLFLRCKEELPEDPCSTTLFSKMLRSGRLLPIAISLYLK